MEMSVRTNSKYDQQSLTYYQNASLWPNDTGGDADIEKDTYLQLVERKHEVAIMNAYGILERIYTGRRRSYRI